MSSLFSQDWAKKYKEIWNSTDGIAGQLGKSHFNSVVAFGIDGEDNPRVVLTISNGMILSATESNDELLNWDIRASEEQWRVLMLKPPGLMRLGLAYTSRKLKFKKGDYAVMIKDPGLSGAFVKCFALMGQVAV